MSKDQIHFALLANRHDGLTEGVRSLLETTFDVVLMKSRCSKARQGCPSMSAVVDLALTRGEGIALVRRLRAHCPTMIR